MTHAHTLQHLDLLAARVDRLNQARLVAEQQVTHRLLADYRAGTVGGAEVYAAFEQLRRSTVAGFRKRWNAIAPDELHAGRIRWTAVHYAPDPDGNWRGEYPFGEDTRTPGNGASVVYVLFDAEGEPVYTGSTQRFRLRMSAHDRDGKRFVYWLACPCPDREAAYDLEARLLRERMPNLNRKVGR